MPGRAPLSAALRLGCWLLLVLLAIPVQAALLRLPGRAKARFPHRFHRLGLRLLGLRVSLTGAPLAEGPVLIAANHLSYMDILVLSAAMPCSFVAKAEVAGWPFFGLLARLQRTVFVAREAKRESAAQAGEIATRLGAGDRIVLFPEGTSGEGLRVLPFRSTLFAAVTQAATAIGPALSVQPVSIIATHQSNMRLGRHGRGLYAWYGAMDLMPHLWALLQMAPLTVTLVVHPAISASALPDRKRLADSCRRAVAHGVAATVFGTGEPTLDIAPALAPPAPAQTPPVASAA